MKHTNLFVLALFFLLSAIFTYPLLFKLNSSVYGYPGDNFGTIWHIWWSRYSITHHIDGRYTPFFNAPLGTDLGVQQNTAILYSYPLIALSFIIGELSAFNLLNFVSFPLAAFFMYLLVKHLTKNSLAAFIAGVMFSFSPYHFWKAYNHADLASIQWFPLYIYSLIKFDENRQFRYAIGAAAVLSVTALTSFYYGYFMLLVTVAFFIGRFLYTLIRRRRNYFTLFKVRRLALFSLASIIFLLPMTFNLLFASFDPSGKTRTESVNDRFIVKTDELLALSARPWDYLFPSEHHPIFGHYILDFCDNIAKVSRSFATQCTHYPQERNLYLGWVGITLSILALFIVKNRGRWLMLFVFLAAVSIWMSFPAFIIVRGHHIYFPSYFLHNIAPMFRTYSRLSIVVLLCVCVLSGFAVAEIFKRLGNNKRAILFSILLFLVIFDFTNIPPFRYTNLDKVPDVYIWLAKQPKTIIAEYPQDSNASEIMFYQRIHEQAIANPVFGSVENGDWKKLENLYLPETVDGLRNIGVKYVVVHVKNIFPPDPYNGRREYEIMSPPVETSNFKIVAQFNEALVYEITD